jgi:hypothetical protein
LCKFEALEDRWLLTGTANHLPQSYADWIPEAVLKARDFLSSNPTLTGDVESWFAEEDAAEAASGIHVTLVELHFPQNLIPPDLSIELVEEMMEELIEDRTPVQDVVEVIFNNGTTNDIDARLATRTQTAGAAQTQSPVRAATSVVDVELAIAATAESQPADEEGVIDQTIAVEAPEETKEVEPEVAATATEPDAAAASFQKPYDAGSDDASESTAEPRVAGDEARIALLPISGERPTFLDHLRTDLHAVNESIDAMLEEMQVLRRDLAEWLEEPPVTFWAKVGIGGVAMLAAWRELRRWRQRRDQPDEEAVDWVFLHSLDHEGTAS